MNTAEHSTEHHCGWPETHVGVQREKGITAKGEFFEKSDKQKEQAPPQRPLPNARSMECQSSEVENVHTPHGTNQDRDRDNPPDRTDPEMLAERSASRQSIVAQGAMLECAHDDRRHQGCHE